ncbi:MAG: pyridoxal phosphate-dependent aminotransferase [Gammaproteobacteria bacterium]
MTQIDRRQALALALGAGLMQARTAVAATAAAGGPRPLLPLNYNENPLGPGPKAREAIIASIGEGWRYADGEHLQRLIAAIATHEQVAPERIAVGSGSGELLHILALGWAARGSVTCAWPTFGQLMGFAERLGATVRRVPLDGELRHDAAAIDAATPSGTSLVYLCNPNNPTGTVLPAAELRELCRTLAARTLVVVDEAYMDFVEPGATESMVDLARGDAQVVVLRTFSKLHGLAGLRVGYAIGRPDLIERMRALELVSPNMPGVVAATASLGDRDFIARSRDTIMVDRRRVTAACRELGMECSGSQGNFVFVRTGMSATEFRDRMRGLGIEVGRPFPPLTDWSRISLGTPEDNTALIAALRAFRSGAAIRKVAATTPEARAWS